MITGNRDKKWDETLSILLEILLEMVKWFGTRQIGLKIYHFILI